MRLDSVYARLARPPFGIKEGVVPVIVLAVLLENQREIALYEEDIFVPALTGAVIERLLRKPKRFAVQRFRIEGSREALFERLAEVVRFSHDTCSIGLIATARALVQEATSLPTYTKQIESLSGSAKTLRDCLLDMRDPERVFLHELPIAFGTDSMLHLKTVEDKAAEKYAVDLDRALGELRTTYPSLLRKIAHWLVELIGLPPDRDRALDELRWRAKRLLELECDPELKGFLVRACDATIAGEDKIVSLATVLGNKPPFLWNNTDIEKAYNKAVSLSKVFSKQESISLTILGDRGVPSNFEMLQISVALPGEPCREEVVIVREPVSPEVEHLRQLLRENLKATGDDISADIVLAGLARVMNEVIIQGQEPIIAGELKC